MKNKAKDEMDRDEVLHILRGVDGWQEEYAEAPSKKDMEEEMLNGIMEDIEDGKRQEEGNGEGRGKV